MRWRRDATRRCCGRTEDLALLFGELVRRGARDRHGREEVAMLEHHHLRTHERTDDT